MPSPLEKIESPELNEREVSIYVKRDDLIHPLISGNKWRKMKYNLVAIQEEGYDTILTFGGAFSNHIYATAAVGKLFKIKTIGVIRGEEQFPLSSTLTFAKSCGMKLHFISREAYQEKEKPEMLNNLSALFGNFYLLPEGGSNHKALIGCREIIEEIDQDFDFICSPCGTGATLSGLLQRLKQHQKAIGFAVLKEENYFEQQVNFFLRDEFQPNQLVMMRDYHFGGYAKISKSLAEFIEYFEKAFNIPLEPIYTGKMMYGIFDLIRKNYFPKGSKIIALHTGGLQGKEGMKEKISKVKNNLTN